VPHLEGPDRVALARAAVEELESDLLILDDGFQHRQLSRDLDLVLIDATVPWGHGYLFPRGLLRERPRNLRRAHLVLVTHVDQVSREELDRIKARINRLAPEVPVLETRHEPVGWINAARQTLGLEELSGRPFAGFCGLGNPDSFRQTLAGLGRLSAWRTFPDHYAYATADVEDLRSWARWQVPDAVLVTTQKDLVKLRWQHLGEKELWALKCELRVDSGQEVLAEKLTRLVCGS
jgi:tetraacyldisaccharide 4'-kinase